MHRRKQFLTAVPIMFFLTCAIALAQQNGVTTFVGRGDKAVVIERDGSQQQFEKQDLFIINHSGETPVVPKKSVKPPDSDTEKKSDEPAQGKQAGTPETLPPGKRTSKSSTSKTQDNKMPANTPEEQVKKDQERETQLKADLDALDAAKKPIVEKLRGIQDSGGWFYDDKDQPLSAEDVKKRLDSGDVMGIKAIDIHQQQWKVVPKPEDKEENK